MNKYPVLISIAVLVITIIFVCGYSGYPQDAENSHFKGTKNFVTTCGPKFCLNGREFKFIGVNVAGLLSFSHAKMDSIFEDASKLGIKVIRVYLDSGGGLDSLEKKLPHADYMFALAEKYDIRIIMTLSWWGGIPQFYGMDFFSDKEAQKKYKELAEFVIGRYKDNPYVFSWELMNEPEYFFKHFGGKPDFDDILNWIEIMAAYIKALDKRHVVSVGTGGVWQYYIGLHPKILVKNYYKLMHQSNNIDFTTIHFYGIRRLKGDKNRIKVLLKKMVKDGHKLGKPVLLEEFGLKRSWGYNKEFWFKFILDTFFSNGGDGAMYWQSKSGTNWQEEYGISLNSEDDALREIVREKAEELGIK